MCEDVRITVAAAVSEAKPCGGRMSARPEPIERMIRHPPM